MLRPPSGQVERLATLAVAGIFVAAGAAIVALLTSGSGAPRPSNEMKPSGTAVALATLGPSLDPTSDPTISVMPATQPPTADPAPPSTAPSPTAPSATPRAPAPAASPSVQPTAWLDISRASGSFGETLQLEGVSVFLNTREPTTEPTIRCDYDLAVSTGYTELVSYDMVVVWTVQIADTWPTIFVGTTPPGLGGWFEGPTSFQSGVAYVTSHCKMPSDPNVATVTISPFQNHVPLFSWEFSFH